jgi:SAM-dependent methyltransferase
VAQPYYGLDTSQDPYHQVFQSFIGAVKPVDNLRILEVGARSVDMRGIFAGCREYVGFDLYPGNGVDVVGDCHSLATYFPPNHFDAVFSISVFEHLAMPWKAALEINRVMAPGGKLFIATHPTWPPHALPWDFWRFSKESFHALLNPATGFEVLRAEEGLPCSIVPMGFEVSMTGMHRHPAYLGVSVLARKTADHDRQLAWNVDVAAFTASRYPEKDR